MGKLRNFVVKKSVSLGNLEYRAWNEWKEGEWVVGKFVALRKDQYEKMNLVLQVEEASWDETLAGKKLNLNHNGMLAKYYDDIEATKDDPNTYVQVTFNGSGVMEKGKYKGKEAYSMDIQIVEVNDGDDL